MEARVLEHYAAYKVSQFTEVQLSELGIGVEVFFGLLKASYAPFYMPRGAKF